MRALSIQFLPTNASEREMRDAVEVVRQLARTSTFVEKVEESRGFDEQPYHNFNFVTNDAVGLWGQIKAGLGLDAKTRSEIAKAMIVVCEGSDGWNNYLLLHHHDPAETIDELR